MRRRDFIRLACGASVLAATTSRVAWAVEPQKMYRLAILRPSRPVSELTENSPVNYWREFFHELRQLGYIEGNNLVVDRFSGEGRSDHYPELMREAAARNPNVIFALALYTSTIPIVVITSDPVRDGLVTSMARPGGNITGVSVDAGLELWDKRLQLFREVVPTMSKLAVLSVKKSSETPVVLETVEKAGLGVAGPFYVNKGSDDEYREVFATMSRSGADALFVDDSPEHITKRQLIGELAAKYRLPVVFPYRSLVEAGGLMSYGVDFVEIFRQAARDIGQILNGANAGDIPFYQPTKFELVINLQTAKALGVTIPPILLARGDEVIE
jgi:putative ABC transport system substrate-binding protein